MIFLKKLPLLNNGHSRSPKFRLIDSLTDIYHKILKLKTIHLIKYQTSEIANS